MNLFVVDFGTVDPFLCFSIQKRPEFRANMRLWNDGKDGLVVESIFLNELLYFLQSRNMLRFFPKVLNKRLAKIFCDVLCVPVFVLSRFFVPRLCQSFPEDQLFLPMVPLFSFATTLPIIWLNVLGTVTGSSWLGGGSVENCWAQGPRFNLWEELIGVFDKEVNFLKSNLCDLDKLGVIFWANIILNFN